MLCVCVCVCVYMCGVGVVLCGEVCDGILCKCACVRSCGRKEQDSGIYRVRRKV